MKIPDKNMFKMPWKKRETSGSKESDLSLTIVLTNWARPDNLKKIIDQLLTQTLKPELFLWNNKPPFSHPGISWQVDSSMNRFCWPRWWMASFARTKYVAVMDDDLIFKDAKVLKDAVSFMRSCSEETVIGFKGVILSPNKSYRECLHVTANKKVDQAVDIVKGRFLMLRSACLEKVSFKPDPSRDILIAEDILVSAKVAGGERKKHIVPAFFAGRWENLPGSKEGLYSLSGHWEIREKARKKFFKNA